MEIGDLEDKEDHIVYALSKTAGPAPVVFQIPAPTTQETNVLIKVH